MIQREGRIRRYHKEAALVGKSQTKLRNLSLISIESTLAATLDYTSLINEFAKVNVGRVKL